MNGVFYLTLKLQFFYIPSVEAKGSNQGKIHLSQANICKELAKLKVQ